MRDLGDDYTAQEARINRIFDRLSSRIGATIMSSAESAVTAVLEQLGKAKGEIDAVIAELQAQAVSADTIARLQAVSQALDDVVADAPEPEPEPEA